MRGNVGLLAAGLCLGLIVGLLVAPASGSHVRRVVFALAHDASHVLGMFGQPVEELAEDLSR